MRVTVSAVTSRRRTQLLEKALAEFTSRVGRYVTLDQKQYATESAVIDAIDKPGRVPARLILLDARGRSLSSEQFASWIGHERDSGVQHLHFAVGPANGWSDTVRTRADLLLSLGAMTFPHELARLMLAEQLYRAFTILSGHPYHSGH